MKTTITSNVVNNSEPDVLEKRLIANGFVLTIENQTYYIQHTSHHHIADWYALEVAKTIGESSKAVEPKAKSTKEKNGR